MRISKQEQKKRTIEKKKELKKKETIRNFSLQVAIKETGQQ
jgi:hypothetical protein